MGCAGSRDLSEEEEYLASDEKSLGYSKLSSGQIDAAFRKFSTHSRLNDRQFRDAIEMLKLPLGEVSDVGNLDSFYSMTQELGCYKLHRLLILGVLLGRGSRREKVQLWFEIYDRTGTHSLSLANCKKMVSKTFAVATDYLLKLNTQRLDHSLLLNYSEHLKSVKAKTCDEIVRRIFRDDIVLSKDTFIVRFEHEADFKDLLTSAGFRRFTYNQYKAKPSLYLASMNPSNSTRKISLG